MIVVLSGVWPLTAFFITPCRVDGLLAGSLVALAWRDEADWTLLKLWAGRLVLGTGCLLLGIALGQRHFLPDADPNREHMASVDGSLVVTVGIAGAGRLLLGPDRAGGGRRGGKPTATSARTPNYGPSGNIAMRFTSFIP